MEEVADSVNANKKTHAVQRNSTAQLSAQASLEPRPSSPPDLQRLPDGRRSGGDEGLGSTLSAAEHYLHPKRLSAVEVSMFFFFYSIRTNLTLVCEREASVT